MSSLKFALRTLFKTPFVTIIAIVSLALGIGANAAIFSCFNQMLLESLNVPRPAELVNLTAPGPKPGSQSCGQAGDCDAVFSYAMFRDLQKVQTVFTGIAAHVAFGANMAFDGQTMAGQGLLVSGNYFQVLRSSRRSAGCSTRTTIASSARRRSSSSAMASGRRSSRRIRTCSTRR